MIRELNEDEHVISTFSGPDSNDIIMYIMQMCYSAQLHYRSM